LRDASGTFVVRNIKSVAKSFGATAPHVARLRFNVGVLQPQQAFVLRHFSDRARSPISGSADIGEGRSAIRLRCSLA
jgi:sulfite reductase beta subunit-like hemoprotein